MGLVAAEAQYQWSMSKSYYKTRPRRRGTRREAEFVLDKYLYFKYGNS
jgi:hypothetical protein